MTVVYADALKVLKFKRCNFQS